jgi:hypothetical protein
MTLVHGAIGLGCGFEEHDTDRIWLLLIGEFQGRDKVQRAGRR